MNAMLWMPGCLAIAAASWFLCLATPRSSSPLRGWKGTIAGLALWGLGTFMIGQSGAGLAETLSAGIGLLALALPCASWWLASRTGRGTASLRERGKP